MRKTYRGGDANMKAPASQPGNRRENLMTATQSTMPTGPQAARPFDQRLSTRVDVITLRYEATQPKTVSRAWWRLQKRIAERHVPAWYPEVR